MQFSVSVSSYLQGYVSAPLRIELLSIPAIERTLRESWHFAKNAWQLQKASKQHAPTGSS